MYFNYLGRKMLLSLSIAFEHYFSELVVSAGDINHKSLLHTTTRKVDDKVMRKILKDSGLEFVRRHRRRGFILLLAYHPYNRAVRVLRLVLMRNMLAANFSLSGWIISRPLR